MFDNINQDYVVIFLIVYYIYKMDQKGRKVLRERNKVD